MLVSINNTIYPYDNTEYNIEYLNPNNIILSYQGPFWGLTGSQCNLSPFVTVAFDGGWTQGNCISTTTSSLGDYNVDYNVDFWKKSSIVTIPYNILSNKIYNPLLDSNNINESVKYSTYSTSTISNTDIHIQI